MKFTIRLPLISLALMIMVSLVVALGCYWLFIFGLASAFVGGVDFPPTLGDFEFNPALYRDIYGIPVLLVPLGFASWLIGRQMKRKKRHAQD